MNDRKNPDPSVVRRARKTATMFGVMAILLLIAFVYAFVQSIAAEKNAEEANRQHVLAEQSQKVADENATEAMRQEAIAKELMDRLNECCKSKK